MDSFIRMKNIDCRIYQLHVKISKEVRKDIEVTHNDENEWLESCELFCVLLLLILLLLLLLLREYGEHVGFLLLLLFLHVLWI